MKKDRKNPRAVRRTKTEIAVASIWTGLLGCKDIELDENFFDLGGDSILALNMLFEINEALGVELPPGVLYDYPELRKLCSYIDELRTEPDAIAAE